MSTTAHGLAPSAAGGPGAHSYLSTGVKMETYESASSEIKALIRQLNKLAAAETLEQHEEALQGFDEDVILDTPFVQLQGRDRIRTLAALAKVFLGTFEIEPKLVTITVPEGAAAKGGKLDVEGIVHWLPHRPWFLPLTLLLPKDIPIFANVSLGIKSHNDKVFFVSGKNHNMPHVPRVLRVIAGWVAGMAASVTEPVVDQAMNWYHSSFGSGTYGTTTTTTGTYGTTGGIRGTATNALGTVRDTAGNIIESAQERVSAATDTAKTFASKVASTVTGHKDTTATTTTGGITTPSAATTTVY